MGIEISQSLAEYFEIANNFLINQYGAKVSGGMPAMNILAILKITETNIIFFKFQAEV